MSLATTTTTTYHNNNNNTALPDWIRAAASPSLVCDVVASDAAPPDGAPVCAADDPDVEKVYRALAYWCIDFSAAPPGFVDNWFELPSAQRAQLVDTVRAFCRELHPDTCLASAAERDDPVALAAIVRAAKREDSSSSSRRRLRSNDDKDDSAITTPAIALLAKFGAMQCLAAALGKDNNDRHRRTPQQQQQQHQQNATQELWFGEALAGGSIDAVHFLMNRFSRLRSLTLFHWESTFWIDYSAMRSGNTAMLDWLYMDCTRPMKMGRMWEAACAATINAPPHRFNALIAWIETRANRTYRAYYFDGIEVTGNGWAAPIRTDNVAALDYLEQHCDWNAADELANDHHGLWITATDTAAAAAPTCGGQEYRPRATLVWLIARARAAGVRLCDGYDDMARHGGLAAMRWLRAQNVTDWWPRTDRLRTFDAYTGAIRTKVPHATATSIMEMIDWLRSEGCPLQFFRTVHTFDPIFAALTTTNLKKVPSSLLCTLLDYLLAAAAAAMPLEYARSLAVHVFQGCCARTGHRPPAILDWICRQCPRLLVALQTDPMVQNMAAVQCVRCCNLAAAQWLLDVARVPPKAFNSKDMFHSSAAEYPYFCKYAVANNRATLRWIEKVGGVASVESALVSAMEAGNVVTSSVIRWLLKLLRPGVAAAVMSTPRMGRAALVDSNLLVLRHVMRWQKKRGECTAWRAPLLLARLAGRYARPTLLRWLYGRRATQRDFGVEWRPEALVVAAEHDRLAAVRWMLRAKYSLRTKRNSAQILAAQELCLLLSNAMLDEAEACRPLLRQWMCRFFGWTDAEVEERVLGGGN